MIETRSLITRQAAFAALKEGCGHGCANAIARIPEENKPTVTYGGYIEVENSERQILKGKEIVKRTAVEVLIDTRHLEIIVKPHEENPLRVTVAYKITVPRMEKDK